MDDIVCADVPVDIFVENHGRWQILIPCPHSPLAVAENEEFLIPISILFTNAYPRLHSKDAFYVNDEASYSRCSRCRKKCLDSVGFLYCHDAVFRKVYTIPLNCSCVMDLIHTFPDIMSCLLKSVESAILRGLRQVACGRRAPASVLNVIKICLPLVTQETVDRVTDVINAINCSHKKSRKHLEEHSALWINTTTLVMELLQSHPNSSCVKPAK